MTLQVVGALSVGVAHEAVATLINMTREIENTVVPTTRTFMCRHRRSRKSVKPLLRSWRNELLENSSARECEVPTWDRVVAVSLVSGGCDLVVPTPRHPENGEKTQE